MTRHTLPQRVRSLIVTRDFLEAEDLRDQLEAQGLGPVEHVSRPFEALLLLAGESGAPHLLVIGSDGPEGDMAQIMDIATARRVAMVVLNGRSRNNRAGRIVHVARPFTSLDIEVAVNELLP